MLDRKSELHRKLNLSIYLSLSLSLRQNSLHLRTDTAAARRSLANSGTKPRRVPRFIHPAADIIPSRGEPKFPRSSGRNPAAEFPSAASGRKTRAELDPSRPGYRLPKMFTSEIALHPLRGRDAEEGTSPRILVLQSSCISESRSEALKIETEALKGAILAASRRN